MKHKIETDIDVVASELSGSATSAMEIWALNGLVIRIGQSLGLHHDGKHVKLSSFLSKILWRL